MLTTQPAVSDPHERCMHAPEGRGETETDVALEAHWPATLADVASTHLCVSECAYAFTYNQIKGK